MSPIPFLRFIPVFTAEGLRWRDSSEEAIERWLAAEKVIVRRNRRGKIVCAQFRYGDGSSPIRTTAHMGQRYSVLRNIGDTRLWQHKKLLQADDIERLMGIEVDLEEADIFVRAVFRAVPLSILSAQAIGAVVRDSKRRHAA